MHFGIKKPKIAVLGLNPHASDDGLLGFEENKIIIPAIKEAADNNILVFGPYPADSFFRSININQFDGVLAMYHDQALIPFKTISSDNGVNFTAGLKYIRTSPDHGTAFNIAGQNKANEQSFRSAVYSACDIYNKRKEFNALQLQVRQSQLTVSGLSGSGGGLDPNKVANHFIPAANNTYDLGSSSRQWRNLFLSGSTLVVDGC